MKEQYADFDWEFARQTIHVLPVDHPQFSPAKFLGGESHTLRSNQNLGD